MLIGLITAFADRHGYLLNANDCHRVGHCV